MFRYSFEVLCLFRPATRRLLTLAACLMSTASATAEPIQLPLIPVPVSQPDQEASKAEPRPQEKKTVNLPALPAIEPKSEPAKKTEPESPILPVALDPEIPLPKPPAGADKSPLPPALPFENVPPKAEPKKASDEEEMELPTLPFPSEPAELPMPEPAPAPKQLLDEPNPDQLTPAKPTQQATPTKSVKTPETEFPLQPPPAENNLKVDKSETREEVTPNSSQPSDSADFTELPSATPGLTPPTGDAPMLPQQKQVLSAALGLALALSPLAPANGQETPPNAIPKPMPTTKGNDSAGTPATANNPDIEDLRKEIQDMRRALDKADELLLGKTDPLPGEEGITRRLSKLEDRVQLIQDQLNRLEQKLDDKVTTFSPDRSGKGTDTTVPPTGTSTSSTIRLVNEYPTEVSLILNGKSYRIAPNEVRTVTVDAGDYSYELLQTGSRPVNSNIKANETVTLRIR